MRELQGQIRVQNGTPAADFRYTDMPLKAQGYAAGKENHKIAHPKRGTTNKTRKNPIP